MELITIEELKELVPGDEVVCTDPLSPNTVMAYTGESDSNYYFISSVGATFTIFSKNPEEIIKAFNVRKIDSDDERWDDKISKDAKEMHEVINQCLKMDF